MGKREFPMVCRTGKAGCAHHIRSTYYRTMVDTRRGAETAPGSSLGELVTTFTFAGDLALGLELDDGLRACYMAMRIAEELGLPDEDLVTVYYASLLKDLGCTCWTTEEAQFWQTEEISARRDLLFLGGGSSFERFVAWMRRYVGKDLGVAHRAAAILSCATTPAS